MYYYVWFITKYRKNALIGKVDKRIKDVVAECICRHGYSVLELETNNDHVHMLVEAKDKKDLVATVRTLKAVSSKILQSEACSRKRAFWARRYDHKEVLSKDVARVAKYIREQKKKPHTFVWAKDRRCAVRTIKRNYNRKPVSSPHTFVWGMAALLVLFLYSLCVSQAYANNVTVSNVVLQNKDLDTGTVEVKFDLAQENTFTGTDDNSQAFYDRVWIFVKYWLDTDSQSTGWHHATLVSGGTVTPTSDGKGAFCQVGANQTVKWDYGVDGVSGSATIKARVNAIEMVYIPQGAFVYNAGGIGGSAYNNYGGGSQATVSATTHIPTGCAALWPNGYSAFYIMKYEVSQGQYADFLNMLDATNATARFPNTTASRHTITYTAGNDYGARYAAGSPNRACNFLNWDDAKSYASWCALRPMTEMEFEKAARGGGAGTRKYPWGENDPSTATYTFDGATITSGYCLFNNVSGGPVNVGHYLSGDIARTNAETGASPYGVTDLAGNNWEHLINCAHTSVPANGDGSITIPAGWPSASAGKGIRGGCWCYTVASGYLRSSDRDYAGWTSTGRVTDVGVRFARTSP